MTPRASLDCCPVAILWARVIPDQPFSASRTTPAGTDHRLGRHEREGLTLDANGCDQMVNQGTRGRSRRSVVGALATSLLAALGIRHGTAAKKARTERCTPAGRRCGSKENDSSCRGCWHRYFSTTPKGKKTCACKPEGIDCGN